eukprot:TRINITY_DN8306_c0_g1_i1.p1 TRINITY_DN8306_c0_g1~~TRINITY_DN8306_c0_g1_i1.p1  ORF type:complete len:217 (-),score=28.20 TRINITY_DN8306_c0_g1_i1:51-671(-)
MGNFIQSLKSGARKTAVRTVMLGLDSAGKTTILYKMALGEKIETIPTIGFNIELVRVGDFSLEVWDVGGQSKIRSLWRHYYQLTTAVIFVIDSSDTDRFPEAKEELDSLLKQESLKDAIFLILCNKQDMEKAATATDICKFLNLGEAKQSWFVQGCSATKGDASDLMEGFNWLSEMIKNPRGHVTKVNDPDRIHYAHPNTSSCSVM